MPFYEIKWTRFGTALIEADNENEAFRYLDYDLYYDEAEVECVLEECPTDTGFYEPLILSNQIVDK